MGPLRRLTRALRNVGIRGVVNDLRWRGSNALGGISLLETPRRAALIVREGGIRSLVDRLQYAAVQVRDPSRAIAPVGAVEPHPWTTTAAHMVSFTPYFDLSSSELDANRTIVESFDQRPGAPRTATWFLPYFHHALFGGIHTILRLMDYMTRLHGVEHRVVIMDPEESHASLRSTISRVFPSLSDIDIVMVRAGAVPYDELPPTDIGVCTLWTTAFALARFNGVGAKYYMVQDYEPSFYPAGSMYGLAEATYRLGFAGLVNTPGLAEIYEGYGNPAVSFTPVFEVGPERKPRRANPRDDGTVQIVLYGRPSIDRNAFELVASACRLLKEEYGDQIHIVSAGERFEPDELGLGDVLENRGLLSTIEEVQDLYRASDIGVCFMFSRHPSYQPFEYLAAGVAPVANVNPATSWFLRDRENCLIVEPFPSTIAEGVRRLIEDEDLRSSIVTHGQNQIGNGNWDVEFGRVWSFMAGSDA